MKKNYVSLVVVILCLVFVSVTNIGCSMTQPEMWTPDNINKVIDAFQLVITDEVLNARVDVVQAFYATNFQMLVQMFTDLQFAWSNGTMEEWTEKYNAVAN